MKSTLVLNEDISIIDSGTQGLRDSGTQGLRDSGTQGLRARLMSVLLARPNSVTGVLKQYKNKKIFIYGAGNVGSQMYELLTQYDIKPAIFLDRNAAKNQNKNGIPVLHPEDTSLSREARSNALVFVSILLGKEQRQAIYENLKTMGYLHCKYGFPWIIRNNFPNVSWKDATYEVFDIFEDEESKNIYARNLLALFLDDTGDRFATPSSEVQYFDKTVPIRRNGVRFVDCGAFDGDTLESLCSNLSSVDAYAGFEPMPANLTKLSDTISRLDPQFEIKIFSSAVGAAKSVLNFVENSSSSRASNDAAGIAVNVVRLDDILTNFRPTFIKMDIEGTEFDALNGAKQIITQNKPDLAICVYHVIDHYWTVPLLLRSWVNEYKFYLRTYRECGMETVLYAVRP